MSASVNGGQTIRSSDSEHSITYVLDFHVRIAHYMVAILNFLSYPFCITMAQNQTGLMLIANSMMKFDSLSKTNKTTGYYEKKSFILHLTELSCFIRLATALIQIRSLNFFIAGQGVTLYQWHF